MRPGNIMVLGPDGEEPAIRTVAQKGCRRIFFVIAKPLLRSESQRHGGTIDVR